MIRLKPLTSWCIVRQLSPSEAAQIEAKKESRSVVSMIFIPEPSKREVGEQAKNYRWCEFLRGPDGYTDCEPGDIVLACTISGSHGINDDFQHIDGQEFFQMPTNDLMGVVER